MRDSAQFYDERKHRRLMPKQNLSDKEITALVAFLDWISKVDDQGWPPRGFGTGRYARPVRPAERPVVLLDGIRRLVSA